MMAGFCCATEEDELPAAAAGPPMLALGGCPLIGAEVEPVVAADAAAETALVAAGPPTPVHPPAEVGPAVVAPGRGAEGGCWG